MWMQAKYDSDLKAWEEEKKESRKEMTEKESLEDLSSWYAADEKEKNEKSIKMMSEKLLDLGFMLNDRSSDMKEWAFEEVIVEDIFESADEGDATMDAN